MVKSLDGVTPATPLIVEIDGGAYEMLDKYVGLCCPPTSSLHCMFVPVPAADEQVMNSCDCDVQSAAAHCFAPRSYEYDTAPSPTTANAFVSPRFLPLITILLPPSVGI